MDIVTIIIFWVEKIDTAPQLSSLVVHLRLTITQIEEEHMQPNQGKGLIELVQSCGTHGE